MFFNIVCIKIVSLSNNWSSQNLCYDNILLLWHLKRVKNMTSLGLISPGDRYCYSPKHTGGKTWHSHYLAIFPSKGTLLGNRETPLKCTWSSIWACHGAAAETLNSELWGPNLALFRVGRFRHRSCCLLLLPRVWEWGQRTCKEPSRSSLPS